MRCQLKYCIRQPVIFTNYDWDNIMQKIAEKNIWTYINFDPEYKKEHTYANTN